MVHPRHLTTGTYTTIGLFITLFLCTVPLWNRTLQRRTRGICYEYTTTQHVTKYSIPVLRQRIQLKQTSSYLRQHPKVLTWRPQRLEPRSPPPLTQPHRKQRLVVRVKLCLQLLNLRPPVFLPRSLWGCLVIKTTRLGQTERAGPIGIVEYYLNYVLNFLLQFNE